jgi:ribonuclease HII
MLSFALEQKIFAKGFPHIGGIDEAGRGPLAGPVVAACVVCRNGWRPNGKKYKNVKDSKKLSEQRREEQFRLLINDEDLIIGIGLCDHATIDKINILQATFLAMKKAVASLSKPPEYLLIDGRHVIPGLKIKQQAIVHGDDLIFLIAAASIIAKVTRDRIMREQHLKYPQYNFGQHKGYGTKEHLALLKKFGPSSIHRYSFSPLNNAVKNRSLSLRHN